MIVAHFKDRFLLPSETFIFSLISSLENTYSIILDRHLPQNPEEYLRWPHFSPATRFGRPLAWAERACLRIFARSPYLEKVVRSEKVQIVHAHFGQLGATITPVVRRLAIPLVTSFYGRDVSVFAHDPLWARRFHDLWSEGSTFLTVGPWMKDQLIRLGCPENRTFILPLAVDCSLLDEPQRPATRPGDPCEIISVGRLIPKKGMDILIRAASLLASSPGFRIRIVGDGPMRRSLEALVQRLKLEDRILFLGWRTREETCRLMQRSHVFVLASQTDPDTGETEGSPMVLLEAQASGLPVVSTFHADIPSIVPQKESGLLVREADPEALALSLRELIADPGLRDRMGMFGRSFVQENHDMKVAGVRLENIYRHLLSHPDGC